MTRFPHRLRGSHKPGGILPRYIPPLKTWVGPFVMEAVNAKVVQESNALLTEASYPYGKDFKYYEGWLAGGLVGASAITAATVGIGAMMALPPLRALARRCVGGRVDLKKRLQTSYQGICLEMESVMRFR